MALISLLPNANEAEKQRIMKKEKTEKMRDSNPLEWRKNPPLLK